MTRRTVFLAAPLLAAASEDAEVLAALDRFMSGWNSREPARYADALHFPHLILEGGRHTLYATREEFLARGKQHWERVPAQWDRSVWRERKIVQRIGDTVHVAGRWARLDKAGREFQSADVLYVVVKKDGRWAIFTRSGNRAAQAGR